MCHWDYETDFVCVGSGCGGLTAALVATLNGLSSLVIEKTEYYGGSTALSGGGVWVPANYLMAEAGIEDSISNALTYMEQTVGDRTPRSKQEAYLDNANEMLVYLAKNSHVKFEIMPGYADYYPEKSGGTESGRALLPVQFEGRKLGHMYKQMRPYPYLSHGAIITLADYFVLSRIKTDPTNLLKLWPFIKRNLQSILLGRNYIALGRGLIGRLRMSLHEHNVPLWLNTDLKDLIHENEEVVGIEAVKDGKIIRIRAKKGIVLAGGGFEHNKEMREKYGKQPSSDQWTAASPGNTGEAIQLGMSAGAAVDLMDEAWWGPSTLAFGSPMFLVTERGTPGTILVNSEGKRFVNEAAPYVDVVNAMYESNKNGSVSIPAHFVMDHRYRNNYPFGILLPGITPKKMFDQGHFHKSETLEGLARQIDVDPQGLVETVRTFNEYARTGKDLDYRRGDSVYDRFYSDPVIKPNPCLLPLDKPPFYSVKLYPGDLGTKGGLVTNENAQVLKEDDTVINGLYAAGNTSASVTGNAYPGPGATIGPAMTFAYLAALHAVNK